MYNSLLAEARKETVAAQSAPVPSSSPENGSQDGPQLPCGCPDVRRLDSGKREGEMSEDKKVEDARRKDVKKNLPAGIIWCGKETKLSAQAFAESEYAAPILWFSPNEPLYLEGKKLPEPLPGDKKTSACPLSITGFPSGALMEDEN